MDPSDKMLRYLAIEQSTGKGEFMLFPVVLVPNEHKQLQLEFEPGFLSGFPCVVIVIPPQYISCKY